MRSWVFLLLVFGACKVVCVGSGEKYPCIPGTAYADYCPPPNNKVVLIDSTGDGYGGACDVHQQGGCSLVEKCTWFVDALFPASAGHVGCAPNGLISSGAPCTFGPPGPLGFDNCERGNVCVDAICEAICDIEGGDPSCADTQACQAVDHLFEVSGQPVAGACARSCDPLADNDALGSGTRVGSACGVAEGCYGLPSAIAPTHYFCMPELQSTLVHRSTCTQSNGCAPDAQHALVNGCAEGYIPLIDQQTGSTIVVCVAFCKPADCWLGNCPNDQLRGVPPHDCTPASARGTFAVASAGGSNGDQCVYSWSLEHDGMGNYIPSQTGDTVGFCIDHSQSRFDIGDGSDAVWPRCDTLDIASGFDAAYFGCVSTTTATAHGHPPAVTP